MLLKNWNELPEYMKNDSVKYYYKILIDKKANLIFKRLFDIFLSIILLIILFPFFIIIGVAIKIDSKGPVFFRQVRVTQYGREFKIFKFRTMVNDAEKIGAQITSKADSRITSVGNVIRKFRLDETPQLFNVILGDMSFVGTRPEIPKYVEEYAENMLSTLLLPAGITSEASIKYKDEEILLSDVLNVDQVYINEVLPAKMKYNLKSMEEFSFFNDIRIMLKTAYAVFR